MNAIFIHEPRHVNSDAGRMTRVWPVSYRQRASAHVKLAPLDVIVLGVYAVAILRSPSGYRAPAAAKPRIRPITSWPDHCRGGPLALPSLPRLLPACALPSKNMTSEINILARPVVPYQM